MNITPHDQPGEHRTGGIDCGYTVREISRILGFTPNVADDPAKVQHSWGFTADGQPCGIWDYNGCRWSTFGPQCVFDALFPSRKKRRAR